MDSLGRNAPGLVQGHVAGRMRNVRFAVPFLGVLAALQVSFVGINERALPVIAGDLGIPGARLVTAVSVVSIAAGATVISAGLLADRLGRRRVLIAGLLIGALGCLLTMTVATEVAYYLSQVLTGAGFGAVFGASFAYVASVARTGKVPVALGVFGATFGVANLGFLFLAQALPTSNARLGFLIPGSVAIVAAMLVPVVLHAVSGDSPAGVDWIGQLLLAGGIASLLFGLSQVGAPGSALFALSAIIVGVVLLLSFYVFESNASNAFFAAAVFETPTFLAAVLAGLIYSFGFAAAMLSARLLWPTLSGGVTTDLSVWQLPLGLGLIAGSFITGRRMSEYTAVRGTLFFGAMLTAFGLLALAAASREPSVLACLPGLLLAGVGAGVVSIPFGYLIFRLAPSNAFGPVTGSRVAIGELGYVIAIALTTLTMSRLTVGDGISHALTVTLGVAALLVLVAGAAAAHLLRGTDSEETVTAST